MIRHVLQATQIVILSCAIARAQCDSTPPRLQPAFTMYGTAAGEKFGTTCFVIHDTAGHPLLCVNTSPSGGFVAVYSRFAGPTDTSYRCCLPYLEAHECHVTSSQYMDYVVAQVSGGQGDSVFLIPGSPDGIWSKRRLLLMADVYSPRIIAGRLDGGAKDVIVIGNPRGPTNAGSLSIWFGRDSLGPVPDTVIVGSLSSYVTQSLGMLVGVTDVDGDGIQDLIAQSGGWNYPPAHEMTVFFGGADFPHRSVRWRDLPSDSLWWYENGIPFGLADVTRDGLADLLLMTYLKSDSVWGTVRSGDRAFVYRAWMPFDTTATLRWRPMDVPAKVCTPYLSGFGGPVVDVGDINGDGQPDIAVGAGSSFGGSGAVVLYVGGTVFDTFPDAYFVGFQLSHASRVVGGFDFNGDGLMDFAVPMPLDDGVGGTNNPAGEVAFIAGARSLRNIGVSGVREGEMAPAPNDALAVFPQPVRNQAEFILRLPEGMDTHPNVWIEIQDIVGKCVARVAARDVTLGDRVRVNCTGMPAGLYSAVVRIGNRLISRTFIHTR